MINEGTYEWDEAKRQSNLNNHGVDFADAASLNWHTATFETQFVSGEKRILAYAPRDQRLYAIVYTMRGTTIRIISLRKANKREVVKYVQNKK